MSRTDGEATRGRLIRAATLLMAEHGIEAVDLKEIQRAAGARNRSAIAYHFGDRDELVRTIGIEHRIASNQRRKELLDRAVASGETRSIPHLVEALVIPEVVELDDPVGRAYLIVRAEAAVRMGSIALTSPERSHVDGLLRLVDLLAALLPGSPARRRRVIGRVTLAALILLADLARDINAGHVPASRRATRVREITQLLEGSLGAAREG